MRVIDQKSEVIFSDSLSALFSIQNVQSQSRQDIVLDTVQLVNNLQKSEINVAFLRIPAHIGVIGNELADRYAKKATEQPNVSMDIKYSKAEMKHMVKVKLREKWEGLWDNGQTGRGFSFYIAFKEKWDGAETQVAAHRKGMEFPE